MLFGHYWMQGLPYVLIRMRPAWTLAWPTMASSLRTAGLASPNRGRRTLCESKRDVRTPFGRLFLREEAEHPFVKSAGFGPLIIGLLTELPTCRETPLIVQM
jgi:hypothetical protein